MREQIIIALLVLAVVLPIGAFYLGERKVKRFKRSLATNIISFSVMLFVAVVFIFSGNVSAAEVTSQAGDFAKGMAFLGAAISTGLGCVGGGIATGQAASAALGALSENESIMGKSLIFVALAEGISIWGVVISVLILGRV